MASVTPIRTLPGCPPLYRPRKPHLSSLYQLVETHYESTKALWEDRFQKTYGFWRGFVDKVVERYLDYGRPESGFARVVCEHCRSEFLLCFTCKGRGLCSSCDGTAYQDLDGETDDGLAAGVYSNVGYAALGAVIDSVTQSPAFAPKKGYERYVWYEVGRGDNLTSGLFTMALGHSWRDGDIPGFAQGYENDSPVQMWEGVGDVEGWEGPAGGWTMTVGDLARFVSYVHRREIVSSNTWSAAMIPRSEAKDRPYGYGMFIESVTGFAGVKRYSHGGDILGYSAIWVVWEGMNDAPPFGLAMQCNQKQATVVQMSEDRTAFLARVVERPELGSPGQEKLALLGGLAVACGRMLGVGHDQGGRLRFLPFSRAPSEPQGGRRYQGDGVAGRERRSVGLPPERREGYVMKDSVGNED